MCWDCYPGRVFLSRELASLFAVFEGVGTTNLTITFLGVVVLKVLLLHSQLPKQKRINIRELLDLLGDRLASPMPCLGFYP